MATEVERNTDRSRYELRVDGVVTGVLDYRQRDESILALTHAEIAPAKRGRGLGDALVHGALEDVRARGELVIPQCWHVAGFLERNPEFRSLVAA
jgi:uncharacterized protein